MDGPPDLVAAQGRDHPLDLAPVAEAHDIAGIAAGFCASRSLESGVVAEPLDELGGVGKRHAPADEGSVHAPAHNPGAVARLRIKLVNGSVTMRFALFPRAGEAALSWGGMSRSSPRAGGFFIMIAILIGFAVGLARGNAMEGVLAGTMIGIAAAVLLWLLDRRRG